MGIIYNDHGKEFWWDHTLLSVSWLVATEKIEGSPSLSMSRGSLLSHKERKGILSGSLGDRWTLNNNREWNEWKQLHSELGSLCPALSRDTLLSQSPTLLFCFVFFMMSNKTTGKITIPFPEKLTRWPSIHAFSTVINNPAWWLTPEAHTAWWLTPETHTAWWLTPVVSSWATVRICLKNQQMPHYVSI